LADSKNVTMRVSETGRNGFTREVNDARFIAPEFFGICICSNENDAIAMNRDCFGVRLLFVTSVNVAVNENYLGRFRVGSNSAHEEQDSSDRAHHGLFSVIPSENASPARTENFCKSNFCKRGPSPRILKASLLWSVTLFWGRP